MDKFDVNSIYKNSSDGYILEEKLKINHDMMSNYCNNIANNYKIKDKCQ